MKVAFALVWLTVLVGICWGWVLNLIALVHLIQANAPVGGLFIGRAVGLFFAPLGAALGFLA